MNIRKGMGAAEMLQNALREGLRPSPVDFLNWNNTAVFIDLLNRKYRIEVKISTKGSFVESWKVFERGSYNIIESSE